MTGLTLVPSLRLVVALEMTPVCVCGCPENVHIEGGACCGFSKTREFRGRRGEPRFVCSCLTYTPKEDRCAD